MKKIYIEDVKLKGEESCNFEPFSVKVLGNMCEEIFMRYRAHCYQWKTICSTHKWKNGDFANGKIPPIMSEGMFESS